MSKDKKTAWQQTAESKTKTNTTEAKPKDQIKIPKPATNTEPDVRPVELKPPHPSSMTADQINERKRRADLRRSIANKPVQGGNTAPPPQDGYEDSEYAKARANAGIGGVSRRPVRQLGEPDRPTVGKSQDNRPYERQTKVTPSAPPSNVFSAKLAGYRSMSGGTLTEPQASSTEGKAAVLVLTLLSGLTKDVEADRPMPTAAELKNRLLSYCDAMPCLLARKMVEKTF